MHKKLIDMGADDPLLVQYWPGQSDRLVVVFSGVGSNPQEYPAVEFFRSATENAHNHALFISDMSRSWLNAPDIDTQIIGIVEQVASENEVTNITLVGNSMGGTMALLLADKVRANAVLSFVPQYSVSSEVVPEEKRWRRYRKNITHYKFKTVTPVHVPDQTVFIVHGGTDGELMHATRFLLVPGVRHFIVPQYGHNMTKQLNRKKVLAPMVSAAIANRPFKFRKLIEREGGLFMRDFKTEKAG